jgi:hypothetical protein
MCALERYGYKPLPSGFGSPSFRPLELLPGIGHEEVHFHLCITEWIIPPYEALSYTWGDPSDRIWTWYQV